MNIGLWNKLKLGWNAMTGDYAGMANVAFDVINSKLLSRLNAETAKRVCVDVCTVTQCVKSIIANHESDMKPATRAKANSVVMCFDALGRALADCRFDPEEISAMVGAAKCAVAAFKEAE